MKIELKKKRILVTGGAGFIGSNLTARLLGMGNKVFVFDNFSTGRMENIKGFMEEPDFKFIKGDLRKTNDIKKTIKGMDYIFHQAAFSSVAHSVNDPKTTFDVNVSGTMNLLNLAKEYNIKKIVFASSASIYGPLGPLPKREDAPPNPVSPYALSKLIAEKLCQTFSDAYNLPTVCLRYFNVFGPRQNPFSEYAAVIPKFISVISKNGKPIIYGDGKQTRDFVFIDDVVDANLKALCSDFNKGEVFNIACGKEISLLEMINILNKILSKNVRYDFRKEMPGDIKHSCADVSKAREKIGYSFKISFEEGLRKTINNIIYDKEK